MNFKNENKTKNNMLQEKINKLIPYISENFITYPLWEEGKYIPFVNFWQKEEKVLGCEVMCHQLNKILNSSGYDFVTEDRFESSRIIDFSIYPDFNETEDGGYDFVKKDWSIEEMITLIEKFLEKQ